MAELVPSRARTAEIAGSPMSDTPPLTIVRDPAWQALVRRLDAAVSRDPRLAEARDVVLRPIELLRVMAADAHGALADDVLRGDRLRVMLFLAWPYVAVAIEARSLLDATTTTNGDTALITGLFDRAAASGAAATSLPPVQPYEPGVIDHAALLVLMLAATRVADPPFAPVFVASVHGLALASSAAEVLGRLDPRQPDADSLDVVLETLYVIESARTITRNEFLRPFVFDPVERGRWRCLEQLLATSDLVKRAISMGSFWDGATSDEILSVKPKSAGVGDTIVVTVRRPVFDPDDPGASDPLRNAKVVFASADGPLLPASATPQPPSSSEDPLAIDVVVPAGASPGWIGFSRTDFIAASNSSRTEIRGLLAALLDEPCVDSTGRVNPDLSVPDYGPDATPRRRGRNRFEGGAPVVVFVEASPQLARPGETIAIRWETAGAVGVVVEVGGRPVVTRGPATGSVDTVAPDADGPIAITVTPIAVRGGTEVAGASRPTSVEVRGPVKIAGIDVTQAGRSSPLFAGRAIDVLVRLDGPRTVASAQLFVDDPGAAAMAPSTSEPGRLTFSIPSDHVRNGMMITVTVTDRTGSGDSRTVGPLKFGPIGTAQIVLVRPAILTHDDDDDDDDNEDDLVVVPPIDIESAHALLIAAGASAGLTVTVVDLPWADDDLAVLVERPAGDTDPALVRVLEALARRALQTPRFEGATWLALLPDPRDPDDGDGDGDGDGGPVIKLAALAPSELPSIARALPAAAARAVAVATTGGLVRLLGGIYAPDGKQIEPVAQGPRLAILGELDRNELTIDDVRADERGAGPGAPVATRLVAVTIDTRGRELDRIAIGVLTESRPALLAALVPISSTVAAVELRDDQGVVRKVIRRTAGEIELSVEPLTETAPRELHWTWNHTQNARPRVSLLLRNGALETPVFSIDPCESQTDLPLSRFTSADALVLYATDGWNPIEKTIGGATLGNGATAVLRRLSDGRYFADIPQGWDVTWRLNGNDQPEHLLTLELAPNDNGVLEIVAQQDGVVLRDSREVLRGDAR